MSDGTRIEWTEATWQVITGCSVLSAGCKNCYAMKLAGGRLKHHPSRVGLTQDSAAGPVWTGEVRFNEAWLDQPLGWSRGRRIFPCAHGDLFHDSVPDEWLDKVFAVMLMTPQHTYQVLTKRALRMQAYVTELVAGRRHVAAQASQIRGGVAGPIMVADVLGPSPPYMMPEHIWLGVSVEDQETANSRIPTLLRTPAAKRWLSCEPLLSRIDLRSHLQGYCAEHDFASGVCLDRRHDGVQHLHWVVAGGESGPRARVMHPVWAREMRDSCEQARVPFFFKQWGEWAPATVSAGGDLGGEMRRGDVCIVKPVGDNDGHFRRGDVLMRRVGKKSAGRELDGRIHDGYPQ